MSYRAKTLVNTSPIVKSAILSCLVGNISPKLDQSKGIYKKKKIAFNPGNHWSHNTQSSWLEGMDPLNELRRVDFDEI